VGIRGGATVQRGRGEGKGESSLFRRGRFLANEDVERWAHDEGLDEPERRREPGCSTIEEVRRALGSERLMRLRRDRPIATDRLERV
jgi:hypothetical protein